MDTYLNEVVHYLTTQSWQIAALTVAVAAANFALRRHSAHVRYLLWLIVLAKCLVPPLQVVPLRVLPQTVPHALPVPSQALEERGGPSDVAPSIPRDVSLLPATESIAFLQDLQIQERRLSWRRWLGVLWIGGAAVCASMNLLRAWRGQRRVRRNRKVLPGNVAGDTADLLAPYGVRRLPKIWTMRGIGQPFVWGLWRGSIYLPASFLTLESRAHRRDVLAHELSHVLRFDPIVNLLQVFAQTLFWFHPMVWWTNRKIRQEREKCCDEMVIAHLQAEPKDYSRALVEALSLHLQSHRFVPSLAIAGPARHIEERIKTMLRPGKRFYRRPSLPATTIAVALALIAVPTTWALANRPVTESQEGDMNAKIAQLQPGASTRQDAIRLLGKPATYLSGDKTFQEDNLPSSYEAVFPNGPTIVFEDGVIEEIRFSGQDVGYVFRERIRLGSSLDDVLAVIAKPRETVVGEPFGRTDGVLYKDGGGQKGYCYYLSSQDHVRMFFEDYKVVALYLIHGKGTGEMPQRSPARKTLAAFDDCRGADLSQLDLSGKKGVLTTLWLNQDVKWPGKDKMPADFRPDDLFKNAMNPGLGVRQLHARGITGKGVNVGIIDQPLFPDHPEFAGKIAAYHDVGTNREMSMHGPAVASLFVGTQCGTAPGARLYHVAAPSWTGDTAYYAKALDWLVEQSKALPASQKIRVISVSAAPSGRGSPFEKNNEMWDEACKRAEAEGILVLDCTSHHGFLLPCWIDANDPENVAKCRPGFPGRPMTRGSSPNEILTPTCPRTTAEGRSTYQYTGRGGLSWGIPYAAGVLAMGWQVRPDLPAEKMKALLLASGREVANGHRIIDPQNFIRQVQTAK
jgi:beta-lactamase regulating signal transducer with metallopeptidase domain